MHERAGPATRPFLVVQFSDPHIGADWGGGDPVAMLAAAVEAAREVVPHPDAVLVSGDLADHGTDVEYTQVRELLAPLAAPLYVLAGNHDDRARLRRNFGLRGQGDAPVQYAADLGPLRLVVIDSIVPGEEPGELDNGRLEWLAATLADAPNAPTLLALHHPPIETGIPGYAKAGLSAAGRRALADIVAAHRQVRLITAGHLHRLIVAELGGRSVLAIPATYVQGRLEFGVEEVDVSADPAAFAIHTFVDGELVSHVQPVA
jgi:3',5'-cyclic-AMP phosphodiesterase